MQESTNRTSSLKLELTIMENNRRMRQQWPYQNAKCGWGAINSGSVYVTAHNNSFTRWGFCENHDW